MEPLPKDLSRLPFNDRIPGMVGKEQCQYLFWIAKEVSNCNGVIAEVGSWLGRSAWHLANGSQRTVHCYDEFRWRHEFSKKCEIDLPDNACFRHIFDNNLKGTHAVSHKVAISELTWELGNIDVLHVDSAKRMPDISSLLTTVGPYLQAGSILILQDFCHEASHDLPFAVALLNDYLDPLHSPFGSMVSFRVKHPIPLDAVALERLSPTSYSYREKRIIWSELLKLFDGEDRERLRTGFVFLIAEHGHLWRSFWQIKSSGMRRESLKRLVSPHHYARYPSVFAAYGFWPTPAAFWEWCKWQVQKRS